MSKVTADAPPRAGRREWIGLAVLALTAMLVSVDVFVLLLALPHLTADLGASSIEQLWIMDIYGFLVGGFLITMGSLGDRIGRRKLLLIGAAAFGAASILAAYSTTPEMLIVARALLGIAGATLAPCTLALISNMFRDPKQMGAAIGIWSAFFTVGAIVGPVIGGFLLNYFWWGSVFLVGVPVMVLVLVLGPILMPEYKNPDAGKLDLLSVVISLVAILPLIYGIKELAKHGFSVLPVVAIVVGIVSGVLFVRRQKALTDPLLDISLFRNSELSVGLVMLVSYSTLTAGVMMLATQHFQIVDGLSTVEAGLALLPGLVLATISTAGSPHLARWIRPAHILTAGLAIVVVGLVIIATYDGTSGATPLIIGFSIWCLGGGPLMSLGIGQIIGAAPPEKAGAASALPQIGNELGSSVGFGVLGSIAAVVYTSHVSSNLPAGLPPEAGTAAAETAAGAQVVAEGQPDAVGSALLDVAASGVTSGLNLAAWISAGVLTAVAVLVFIKFKHIPPFGSDAGSGDSTDAEAATADHPDDADAEARRKPVTEPVAGA
ncbi:MFS transporter [Actinokineospora sp. 24-640]